MDFGLHLGTRGAAANPDGLRALAQHAEAMGLAVDLSAIGLGRRSTRYVLCAKDGVIDILKVEKSPGDLEETSAEAIRKLIMAP